VRAHHACGTRCAWYTPGTRCAWYTLCLVPAVPGTRCAMRCAWYALCLVRAVPGTRCAWYTPGTRCAWYTLCLVRAVLCAVPGTRCAWYALCQGMWVCQRLWGRSSRLFLGSNVHANARLLCSILVAVCTTIARLLCSILVEGRPRAQAEALLQGSHKIQQHRP